MRTLKLQPDIIYGPVRSRRLNWSLGLNNLPFNYKLCSFNCVYCQYGWTPVCAIDVADRLDDFPTVSDFSAELEAALRASRETINNITFSGNGEPTLHPRFEEMVDIARKLRDEYFPEARIGILSNSSTVAVDQVQRGLAKLDFRIMKLDVGSEEAFRSINRPCPGVDYQAIVHGLKSLAGVTLQAMFVAGKLQNSDDAAVSEWIERVGEIKPLTVQIYSLHRPPAASSLAEVPRERLEEIAARTEAATGVTVEVIVAARPFSKRYNNPNAVARRKRAQSS